MIVVTGATGRTGRRVTELLLARGEQVRAVGRDANKLAPLVQETRPSEKSTRMVGDGDTTGVASQVPEDILRTAEGRLGIYDPRVGTELLPEQSEVFRIVKLTERGVELELVLGQEMLEPTQRDPSSARPPPGTTQWTWE